MVYFIEVTSVYRMFNKLVVALRREIWCSRYQWAGRSDHLSWKLFPPSPIIPLSVWIVKSKIFSIQRKFKKQNEIPKHFDVQMTSGQMTKTGITKTILYRAFRDNQVGALIYCRKLQFVSEAYFSLPHAVPVLWVWILNATN